MRCLVLAVRGLRAPQCARELLSRGERRQPRLDAAGQPRRDFLEQPAVAVGVAERDERAVAAVVGGGPRDPPFGQATEPRAPLTLVEYLAHVDSQGAELLTRCLDIGDDQVQRLSGTGHRVREVRPELDRACGPWRRELDQAKVLAGGKIRVQPPA